MDIEALRAFIEITEHQSFSKAASHLHITQPAISKRIKVLEEELGSPLFERQPKSIILTEAGQVLLPRARALLSDVSSLKQALTDLRGTVGGDLYIAASHHVGLHHLPSLLKDFCQTYEQVNLHLQFSASEEAYQQLLANRAELALITLPETIAPQLLCHYQWPDPLQLVCAKNHPLAKVKTQTLGDIASYRAVLPSTDTITYRQIEKTFARNGLSLNASVPTNDLETIKMMVAVGMGWSALPETMLGSDLQVLNINEPLPSRRIGILSSHKSLGRAATAFIHTAKQHWEAYKSTK